MVHAVSRRSALLILLVLVLGLPAPAAAQDGGDFRFDTWRPGAFASQRTLYWCVGASVQMMRNLALGRSERDAERQWRYLRFAQQHDLIPGSSRYRGTDAVGWAAAADRYLPGEGYTVLAAGAAGRLLDETARRMRLTGLPAGLVVRGGLHAWVMTGFTATGDPRDGVATVTGAWIAGPLWPRRKGLRVPDPAPHTWLDRATLIDLLLPVRDGDYRAPWEGERVAIVPVPPPGPTPTPSPTPTPTPLPSPSPAPGG